MRGPIIFRTDASSAIGTGHFMRCFALADAFVDNGEEVIFALIESIPDLDSKCDVRHIPLRRINAAIGSREDSLATAAIAKESKAEWVVIDGYCFDSDYQETLQNEGLKVLMIDDFAHAESYSADLILNQNACANEVSYKDKLRGSRLLSGTKFASIRREFLSYYQRRSQPLRGKAASMLITLGGSDPDNRTAEILRCLERADIGDVRIDVAIGIANHRRAEIYQLSSNSERSISVYTNPPNLVELMASTDLVMTAGGTTTYELCFLGIPFVTNVIAENQLINALNLEKRGVTITLDIRKGVDCAVLQSTISKMTRNQSKRDQMRKKGLELVDGYGADRVLMWMRNADIWLRRANTDDAKAIESYCVDHDNFTGTFNSLTISKQSCSRDFHECLEQKSRILLIASDRDDNVVGLVRFDVSDGEAEICVSMRRNRNLNLAKEMIVFSSHMIKGSLRGVGVHAYVRKNEAQWKQVFESAGYVIRNNEGSRLDDYHLVLER